MTNPAGRPALGRHFTYQLNTLSKLNNLASQADYLAGSGLSLPEARTLAAVGSFPDLTVNALALEVNLDKGQASRLARAMVAKGLLEALSSPEDKRLVRLRLSPTGQPLWANVMDLIEARNRALLDCLSPDEQAQLVALFERVLAQAKARHRGAARS